MDLNLMMPCARLVTPGNLRTFESGSRLLRLLVSVRTEAPTRRVDVVPVMVWDPDDDLVESVSQPEMRVLVLGSVQRRFWESPEGRRSRLEVVPDQVAVRPPDAEEVEA